MCCCFKNIELSSPPFPLLLGSILSPATPGVGGVVPGLGSVTPRIGTATPGVEAFTPLSTLLCPHNTNGLCGYEEGR